MSLIDRRPLRTIKRDESHEPLSDVSLFDPIILWSGLCAQGKL